MQIENGIIMLEQRTILNEAQLGILRLLGRMKSVEQVNELRQIISNYYAQKATEGDGCSLGQWRVEPREKRSHSDGPFANSL